MSDLIDRAAAIAEVKKRHWPQAVEAAKAIAALAPAQGVTWQPIETAPKDGTRVLLWFDGTVVSGSWNPQVDIKGNSYGPGGWDAETLPSHGCGCCSSDNDPPTYWMPLREPTIAAASGGMQALADAGTSLVSALCDDPEVMAKSHLVDLINELAAAIRQTKT